ncbi:hypothetical protein AB0B50_43210 [Streptomyces sp. NPDC041068]|uniref:hypothetical protein n=1 Tax=Streptomyces sp. NPDC041068 TaxID=3155130 RepID=UPI0033DCCF5E
MREAVGARGAEGVDELVRPHKQQLAKWHEALDGFVGSIRSDDRVPQWAAPVIKKEGFELYRTHEFMTNAVMEYYSGGSPPRPSTVGDTLDFTFSTATVKVDLAPCPRAD